MVNINTPTHNEPRQTLRIQVFAGKILQLVTYLVFSVSSPRLAIPDPGHPQHILNTLKMSVNFFSSQILKSFI